MPTCYWVQHHTRCPHPATHYHTNTPLCDTHYEWMRTTDRKLTKMIMVLSVVLIMCIIRIITR